MKKLLIIFALCCTKVFAFQSDSTVVEFDDKRIQKKIKVVAARSQNFIYPEILDLRNVLINFKVEDNESERVYTNLRRSNRSADTLTVTNTQGSTLTIIARNLRKSDDSDFTFEPTKGDNKDEEIVSYEPFERKREFDVQIDEKKQNASRYFNRSNFDIYLGLNNYTNEANIPHSELRIWPSRYIALSYKRNINIANGERVQWALTLGPEFAWHNFMLKNSNKLDFTNGQAEFIENPNATQKSKFVVPHFNLPLMLNIGFKQDQFNLALGGYIGYVTGGRTKEKYTSDNSKNILKGETLGLERVKYGLTAEIGKRYGASIFIRYDLGQVFRNNQMHMGDMTAYSFGIKL